MVVNHAEPKRIHNINNYTMEHSEGKLKRTRSPLLDRAKAITDTIMKQIHESTPSNNVTQEVAFANISDYCAIEVIIYGILLRNE